MIVKQIHYFWFGGKPLSKLAKRCIKSWEQYCPDYKIIQWNEGNYNINKNLYMKQAYEKKKWAFASDFARLDVVYTYGGIYLDTDVELIASLDRFLIDRGFAGLEKPGLINLGLGFGANKKHPVIKSLMNNYENIQFLNSDGTMNLKPSPILLKNTFLKLGLEDGNRIQVINNEFKIYPKEYFNPFNLEKGTIEITNKTVAIHHFAGSWTTFRNKSNKKLYYFFVKLFGNNFASKLKFIYRKLSKR